MKPIFFGSSNHQITQGFSYSSSIASNPPVKGLHPLSGNGPNKLSDFTQKFFKPMQNFGKNLSSFNSSHHAKEKEEATTGETFLTDLRNPRNHGMPMIYSTSSSPELPTSYTSRHDFNPPSSHVLESTKIHPSLTSASSSITTSNLTPWESQYHTFPCPSSSELPGSMRSMKAPNSIRLSSARHCSIDIIDAQSGYSREKADIVKDRVKAIGMRNYGEDVADRNMLPILLDQSSKLSEPSTAAVNPTTKKANDLYTNHKMPQEISTEPATSALDIDRLSKSNKPHSSPQSCDGLTKHNVNVSVHPHSYPLCLWLANQDNMTNNSNNSNPAYKPLNTMHISSPSLNQANTINNSNIEHKRLNTMHISSPASNPERAIGHQFGFKSGLLSNRRPSTSGQTQRTSDLLLPISTRERKMNWPRSVDETQNLRETSTSELTRDQIYKGSDRSFSRSKNAPEFLPLRPFSASSIDSGIKKCLSPLKSSTKKLDLGKESIKREFDESKRSKVSLEEPLSESLPDVPPLDGKARGARVFDKLSPTILQNITPGSFSSLSSDCPSSPLRHSFSMNLPKHAPFSLTHSSSPSVPTTPLSSKEPLGVIIERRIANSPAATVNCPADPPVVKINSDRICIGISKSQFQPRKPLFPIRFNHKDCETSSEHSLSSAKIKKIQRISSSQKENDESRRHQSSMTDEVLNEREFRWKMPRPSTMMTKISAQDGEFKSVDGPTFMANTLASKKPKVRSFSLSASLFPNSNYNNTPLNDPQLFHQFTDDSSNNSDESYLDDNSYDVISSPPLQDGEELLFHDDIYGSNFGGMLPGLCIQSPMYICQLKE